MNRAKVSFYAPKEIRAQLESGLSAAAARLGDEFPGALANWLDVVSGERPRRDPSLPRVLSAAEWGMAGAKGGRAGLPGEARFRIGDLVTVAGDPGSVSGILYRVLMDAGETRCVDQSEVSPREGEGQAALPLPEECAPRSTLHAPGSNVERGAENVEREEREEPPLLAATVVITPEAAPEPAPEAARPAQRGESMKSDIHEGDRVTVAGQGPGKVTARDTERAVYRVLLDDGRVVSAGEKNVFAEGAPSGGPAAPSDEEESKPARKPGRPPKDKSLRPEADKG